MVAGLTGRVLGFHQKPLQLLVTPVVILKGYWTEESGAVKKAEEEAEE